jgi:hypothetical protein
VVTQMLEVLAEDNVLVIKTDGRNYWKALDE